MEVVAKLELLLAPVGIEWTDTTSGSMGAWSAHRRHRDWFEGSPPATRPVARTALAICLARILEGSPDHCAFSNAEEELSWLADHLDQLMVTSFLNSDELDTWKVKAARRMFG